jgi:hypothetical protein
VYEPASHEVFTFRRERVRLSSSLHPGLSNTHSIRAEGEAKHHSSAVLVTTFFANFRERRWGEVRMNRGSGSRDPAQDRGALATERVLPSGSLK